MLCVVSHVVLRSCRASESGMKGCGFQWGDETEVIAKSGLCSAAQYMRCPGSLSDRTRGCWLKTTRKVGYSRGWEKQSNCQRGHKIATAEAKDTTHSLTALSVFLPSRWAEGGWWPPCTASVPTLTCWIFSLCICFNSWPISSSLATSDSWNKASAFVFIESIIWVFIQSQRLLVGLKCSTEINDTIKVHEIVIDLIHLI